jgi:nucleotide-binding universal stress UspA family protein
MYQKILLPTDGSEPAERAGEYIIARANVVGGEIIVLYVIDTHYLDVLPQKDLQDQLEMELRERGRIAVENFKQKLEDKQCDGKCTNVNITISIKVGKPADVILKTIEEEGVDQVIMGKSGKHGLEKFILGSTAEKVVRSAKVPVELIP